MTKKRKIIRYVILTTIIIVAIKIVVYETFKTCGDCGNSPTKNPVTVNDRLDDSDLLYASSSSFGLCRNDNGEQGGCYTEYYLYSTGEFVKIFGWQGINGEEDESPSEKNLGGAIADQVTQQLRDSGVMAEDCSSQRIMDASWDYQINLDGTKVSFHNPPEICKSVFDSIDDMLE